MSDHFDGKRFFDPEVSNTNTFFRFLKWRVTRKPPNWPDHIAVKHYDVPPKVVLGDNLRVSNIGHVTFLIQTQGINILTDPVWSDRASPVSFAGSKRIIDPGVNFEDLPPIDIVWISHNHYDHLDIKTIERLWKIHKPRIITPLGNDKIIHSYNKEVKVEAYDWGDEIKITKQVKFHLGPMQHWSARGIFDHNKALWSALTIETDGGNIYFVGDSGYGEGRYFKRALNKFGQFRLALLPMGAHKPRWFMEYAHMNPDDMVQAHIDLGKPFTIPSHYNVFQLADESYYDALVELKKAQRKYNIGNNIKIINVGEYWKVPKIR
ncbi:MAG: MBL fold metallo-hydrolase [Rickettsiaceae bacterium]|nr:MBL fold metallo-hydrolase [Rickettsiaceae bacterium]